MTTTETASLLGSVDLAGEPTSAREARQYLRRLLGDDFPRLDDAELLVSELVTNSIRHSRSAKGGRITLAVARPADVIHIDVIDEGAETLPLVDDDAFVNALGDGGRGLALVKTLADGWGVHDDPAGRCVWFEFRIRDGLEEMLAQTATDPTGYEFLMVEPVAHDARRVRAVAIYDIRRPRLRLTLTPDAWSALRDGLTLGHFDHI
jgi:anti-sigma regulatory factor (Ser/Thr protein kinase)